MSLSDDLDQDLQDVFFADATEFNTAATWTKRDGTTATINGIFDEEYVEVQGTEGSVGSTRPVFDCATSDIAGMAHGETLTLNGLDYEVAGPTQPDGTGVSRVRLWRKR